jgi:hypothetical protein
MALQMPLWPWHGLRLVVDCFSPFLGSQALPLQLRRSLGARFLIVCVEYGYEDLVRDSSYC